MRQRGAPSENVLSPYNLLKFGPMRAYGSLLLLLCTVACGSSQPPPNEPETRSDDDVVKWDSSRSPAPTPKSKGATVNEAQARRTDEYDREETEKVLQRSARQVKENCGEARDEDGNPAGPWGTTTIQVQLGANGHSKGVVVSSPFEGTPTGRCVEKAFSNLTFPPWSGADTQVDWEVEIVKPADLPKAGTKSNKK